MAGTKCVLVIMVNLVGEIGVYIDKEAIDDAHETMCSSGGVGDMVNYLCKRKGDAQDPDKDLRQVLEYGLG